MVTRPHNTGPDDGPAVHATVPLLLPGSAQHTVPMSQLGGPVTVPRPAADTADSIPPPARHPRLVVVRGEAPGAVFPLLAGKNYLGRAGDKPVDIDLTPQEPVERVWTSRQHACVTADAAGLLVEDLVSLNGTFVNRDRLHPGHPKPLHPGDVVQVGEVQLRVELV